MIVLLSKESLEFFAELLGQVQLNAGHPDFEKEATRIISARNELEQALAQAAG